MRRVRWLVSTLALGACAVAASGAVADPPTPQPGPNSGPSATVAPPFAPPAGATGASASAPMTRQCQRTPALDAAVAVNPPTSVAAVQALCRAHGKPLAAATASVRRHRKAHAHASIAPSLCGNAGCAYIWLYNLHNSYGEVSIRPTRPPTSPPCQAARWRSPATPRATTPRRAGPTSPRTTAGAASAATATSTRSRTRRTPGSTCTGPDRVPRRRRRQLGSRHHLELHHPRLRQK